jgi:hypothetical protein
MKEVYLQQAAETREFIQPSARLGLLAQRLQREPVLAILESTPGGAKFDSLRIATLPGVPIGRCGAAILVILIGRSGEGSAG